MTIPINIEALAEKIFEEGVIPNCLRHGYKLIGVERATLQQDGVIYWQCERCNFTCAQYRSALYKRMMHASP